MNAVDPERTAPRPLPPPAILCISLPQAVRRWQSVRAEVARELPDAMLVRFAAVHWRDLDLAAVPMTPFTRFLVERPTEQHRERVSHRQMDTPSSLGCMLSHIGCWEWLRARPERPSVLILEDDVCLEPGTFAAAWRTVAAPALAAGIADVVVLGYFRERGLAPAAEDGGVAPAGLLTADAFFGAHAYGVSQRGAEVLLRHAFPLELQADGHLLTLGQLGLLRLRLLARSLATQCNDHVDRQGSWHTHAVVPQWGLEARDTGLAPAWLWVGALVLLVMVLLSTTASKRAASETP